MSAAKTAEIEHGTYGGYQRCVRRTEGSCPECRAANSAYLKQWRWQNRAAQAVQAERQAARDRALRKLAERFPREMESLYAAELAALDQGSGRGGAG